MSTYPSEQFPLSDSNAGPGGPPSPQAAPAGPVPPPEPPVLRLDPLSDKPLPEWVWPPEPRPERKPRPASEPASGTDKPAGARRRRGPGRDWREVARLLADGHHPIVIANMTQIPLRVIRRQLRTSRRLRGWVEELRRINADHIGWRMQALRNELAESLMAAIKNGDRTLIRWLGQELALAHVPASDPAGTPPEPKARSLAGRYDPSAIAAAREADAEAGAGTEPEDEEHGTYEMILGDWDSEKGAWTDPRTRDHVRQVWYGPDGRKSVVITQMGVTDWREFVGKRLGAAEAEARISWEKTKAAHEALVARNNAKAAADEARLKAQGRWPAS